MSKYVQHTIKIVLFTIMVTLPVLSFAISNAGVIFLLMEPGARSGAMGQAYVAQVDDAFAGYWNPGAMAFNRKQQWALMHSNWFGDIGGIDDMYYEYLAWNNYFEDLSGNLGFHAIYLTYGSQEARDEWGEDLGTFHSYEVAFATTYSYQYSDNLGLGITFKFIFSDLAPAFANATGSDSKGQGLSFAFDLGLKKKNIFIDKLDFGLNFQNIGPNITYIDDEQSDPLPMNLRLGFSYRLLESEFSNFTINADMNKELANEDPLYKRIFTAWYDDGGFMSKREIESTIFNVGVEYVYWSLLALRAGYIYDKAGDFMGPSFGGGVQYTFSEKYKAHFDFAMQQAGELTDYNKIFTVKLEF